MHILCPLAVSRIVWSPDWKRIPLFLAAVVFMMVLVQPVSGVARIWDLFPLLSVSQSSSLGVPASDLSVLASWMAVLSSSSSAFSVVAALALSLLLGVLPLRLLLWTRLNFIRTNWLPLLNIWKTTIMKRQKTI